MNKQARALSTCPITFTANIIGDPWSLLIARDIIFHGKRTYSEFLDSSEHITTSMLADKLAHLEQQGLLIKSAHHTDKRKVMYTLAEEGLDLFIPVLVEMANWGLIYNPRTTPNPVWVRQTKLDKAKLLNLIRETVRRGGSVFRGENNVINQLEAR